MKFLFLSQGRRVEDQPDFNASFLKALGADNFRNIPFVGYIAEHGEAAFYRKVLEENEAFKPDVVFFQFYHSGGDAGIADCCRALKQSPNAPLVFGSIGDPFWTGPLRFLARPLPKSALDLARFSDAFFATAMGNVADALANYGGRNIIFLPNAFCPEHFPDWEMAAVADSRPEFDAVMLCSHGRMLSRKPLQALQTVWRRDFVARQLFRSFGRGFSVFGRGWNTSFSGGSILFKEQVSKVFRRGRVAVDAPAPILKTDYYTSDRAFFILGSGTPMVFFRTPRIERVFREDEQAYFVDRLRDVSAVCRRVLALPKDVLDERRRLNHELVKSRHLIEHRVDTIISTAEALLLQRDGRITARDALRHVRMHHFLPDVDLESEYPHCVRNWVGFT